VEAGFWADLVKARDEMTDRATGYERIGDQMRALVG
jgi:hypothetical protein